MTEDGMKTFCQCLLSYTDSRKGVEYFFFSSTLEFQKYCVIMTEILDLDDILVKIFSEDIYIYPFIFPSKENFQLHIRLDRTRI